MKIIEKRIEELIDYARNPRRNEQAVDSVAASLKEFGWRQPVVIDSDGVIVVGHTRVKAAKKLGMTKAPCLVADDLTPEQVKAYRILDNKIGEKSDWDYELLELELAEIKLDLSPFDVTFDGAVPSLLDEKEAHEDDFDPTSCDEQETYIKLGDVIELGPHKVFCADIASFDEDLSSPADMWITDPPYGVSYVGKTKDALKIQNDDLSQDGLRQLWDAATDYALRNIRVGGACYASVPAGPPSFIFFSCWLERDVFRQELCWIKDSMVLGRSDYHYKHEPILYGWKPGAAHFFTKDRTRVSTLEYARPKRSSEHPTMKPVELWAELIRNSSPAGGTVLDTFLGSGTTLIAAEQLGRICYGTEISPKYCQVIIERYRKHCENAGKPFDCKINGEVFAR